MNPSPSPISLLCAYSVCWWSTDGVSGSMPIVFAASEDEAIAFVRRHNPDADAVRIVDRRPLSARVRVQLERTALAIARAFGSAGQIACLQAVPDDAIRTAIAATAERIALTSATGRHCLQTEACGAGVCGLPICMCGCVGCLAAESGGEA